MKKVFVLLLLIVLFAGCSTVNLLQEDWETMPPEKVRFEKVLLFTMGAGTYLFTKYATYLMVTTKSLEDLD